MRESPLPVSEYGECVVAEQVKEKPDPTGAGGQQVPTGGIPDAESDKKSAPLKESEIVAMVTFKAAFDLCVEEVRVALAKCDLGCPFGHYTKSVCDSVVDLKGHPIVCYTGDSCTSTLRILIAASTHYPVLRKFLACVTDALSAHRALCDIDNALNTGNYKILVKITGVISLLSCDVEDKYKDLQS